MRMLEAMGLVAGGLASVIVAVLDILFLLIVFGSKKNSGYGKRG